MNCFTGLVRRLSLASLVGRVGDMRRTRRRNRSVGRGIEAVETRLLLSNDFLLTWGAGLVVGDFGGSRGGIFVSRPDGSDMRQLTVSQTDNYQFSGDGINLPDDHPSFSPDGKQIVFTTSRYQVSGETNNFEIAVMNVDGTNVRRLTFSPGIDTEPVFSPDGSKIAFSSERLGNLDIWVMNADGTGLQRLTSSSDHENEPAWSHAGDRLAYTRILFGGLFGVFGAEKDSYIMNADGSNKQVIAGTNREEHDAVWSLNDQRLILTSEIEKTLPFGDVTVIDIATRQYVSNLTVDDRFLLIGGGGDPTLSPDGTKIAYFKATGGPLLLAGPQELFVMNANGTGKVRIPAPGIINVHPHFGKLADSDLDGKPDYIDINTPSDFNQAMIQDEARVIANLGTLTTLNGTADVARLAARGYFPAHDFDSFQGQGVAFARDINGNDPSVLGIPDILLYQPDLSGGRNPTDIFPDFNYRLISWGYASDYDPAKIPAFAGFPEDAWLVHEAGFHQLSNGEFQPTPPAGDSPRGSQPGNVRPSGNILTPWHPRLWDIHFFRKPNGGTPVAAIQDPFGRFLPGHSTGTEAFFYPHIPFHGVPRSGLLVEAEDFDLGKDFGWKDITAGNSGDKYRVTDVDIEQTRDEAVGFDVVNIKAAEFLQYTVDINTTGTHELTMRLSNGMTGAKFHVEVDGTNQSGSLNIPVTNTIKGTAYATFVPFTASLTAGKHRIRLVFETVPFVSGFGGFSESIRFNSLTIQRQSIPSASVTNVARVLSSEESTLIHVTYRDTAVINASTIVTGNLQVTGPNGFQQIATLVSRTASQNASSITATYRIDARGTSWDPGDNGTYVVSLLANQVRDITGVAVPLQQLESFEVAVLQFGLIEDVFHRDPTFVVSGTESSDTFVLTQSKDGIVVTRNREAFGTIPPQSLSRIVVNGVGGNDIITATGVTISVLLVGGAGDDNLTGGSGDDTLLGGAGDDVLDGGAGTNVLDEGAGTGGVRFNGTPGNDLIRIDREVDSVGAVVVVWINGVRTSASYQNGETIIVHAGAGDDRVELTGSARQFWSADFFGEEGDDVLIGGDPGDSLHGDAGNDRLIVRNGRSNQNHRNLPSTVDGGPGDDTYVFDASQTTFVISDAGGTDLFDFSRSPQGVKVDLGLSVGASQKMGGGNSMTLNDQIENLIGSQFNDELKGNAADNIIRGGSGNDTLTGGSGGFDLLIGGPGRDTLTTAASGNSILIGGSTAHDSNDQALLAILNEWRHREAGKLLAIEARISHLTGTTAGGLNGSALLTLPGTVADDHRSDTFKGSAQSNWFFKSAKDRRKGQHR